MSMIVYLLVALLLYVAWLPTIKLALNKLSCKRSFSRTVLYAGEEGEMVEIIRNESPFMVPWVRMESRGSPYMRLGSQENLDVSGDRYYSSLFAPMPYQQIRRTHKVRFLRRGVYRFGNASLTAGDFLDVFRLHKDQDMDTQVHVYPELLDRDRIPAQLAEQMDTLAQKRTLLQDPFLVRGIRPYVPGDPVRDIHWPATARMGQAQLRLRDDISSTKLLVVLNGQAEEMQWGDRLPERLEESMEKWISLAATLCVEAIRQGTPAGFASNMSLERDDAAVVLEPELDGGQEDRLLTAFARLDTAGFVQRFPDFLQTLEACEDTDILILSCYDSQMLQNTMEALRRNGNHVQLHLLEGGGV